jgi:hypothetical protein
MRTYYSPAQYNQDVAVMAAHGYRVVNLEEVSQTNGLALTLLLIFGLLLTPFCVGVVILCFLPLAFGKRYNVSYVFQPLPMRPVIASPYSQPLQPSIYSQPLSQPYPQPYQPTMPPGYNQPLQQPYQPNMPPAYSQPLAQSYQPTMASAGGHSATPPTYQAQSVSLGARFSAGTAYLGQQWKRMTLAQRVLTVIGIVVVGVMGIACAVYILIILSGGAL